MKLATLLLLLLFSPLSVYADSAKEIAVRIIRSYPGGGYNPVDSSEQELNRAAVYNSHLRLSFLMCGETVSEELRLCYALQVAQSRLALLQSQHMQPEADKLSQEIQVLAVSLRGVQDKTR